MFYRKYREIVVFVQYKVYRKNTYLLGIMDEGKRPIDVINHSLGPNVIKPL